VRFGRPRKLNIDQAKVATQLLAEGKAVRARLLGLPQDRVTMFAVKRVKRTFQPRPEPRRGALSRLGLPIGCYFAEISTFATLRPHCVIWNQTA